MSPDTQQNIMHALYLLVLHNALALLYASALAISTISALIMPSRAKILLMIGFSLLLFAYQYEKHIQEPLLVQTRTSLITERPSERIERAISIVIEDVAHYLFIGTGVVCVMTASVLLLQPAIVTLMQKHRLPPVHTLPEETVH